MSAQPTAKWEELAGRYLGRMNDPTASAYLKGICGEEMEFYLLIEDGVVAKVRYFSEGCLYTKACAAVVADFAQGKTVEGSLSVSAGDVIERLKDLPDPHKHCSILAVSAFYRAVADYLLRP